MPNTTTDHVDGKPAVFTTYDDPEQARIAVKLLVNRGFSAEQLFVLCTDEKRSEAFRSRLMPAGATQLNSAPTVVGTAGAAVGAGLLGAVGLTAGGVGAVAGAALGAVAGAGVGILLGAGTINDDETKRLGELHASALERGLIVVQVTLNDSDLDAQRSLATDALEAAKNGVV